MNMDTIKNSVINECIGLLKRDDIKTEFKGFIKPIIDVVLAQINPYLYICIMFIVVSFLLHLVIFIMFFRNNYFTKHLHF